MTSVETPNDPLSRFSLSVFRMNGLLLSSGEMVSQPLGQSSARWQVLGRAGHRPQTVARMARSIGISRQSVQRVTDVLEKEGLVAYQDNPADKRARLVMLTGRGMYVLDQIHERDKQWSRELITQLDASQLEKIAGDLDEISKTLESYIDNKGENI